MMALRSDGFMDMSKSEEKRRERLPWLLSWPQAKKHRRVELLSPSNKQEKEVKRQTSPKSNWC